MLIQLPVFMRVLTVIGNRPQFVKAAAVSFRLRESADEVLVHTGQHYDADLSQVFFDELALPRPEHQLELGGGSNTEQTARMLEALEPLLAAEAPDVVLVYGDTNSTLAGALAAAQTRIPVAHVEAGMRSFDRSMPEELNRVLADHASDLLLCPSAGAGREPARARACTGEIVVVGDVMVDVGAAAGAAGARADLGARGVRGRAGRATCSRPRTGRATSTTRSGWSGSWRCWPGCPHPVVLPLHPRTRARLEAAGLLGELEAAGVRLVPPLGYLDFTALLLHARAVLTDSGGVQKEAYLAGVPCVTLRDRTEWTETVRAGWNVLVGLDADAARAALEREPPGRPPAAVRRRPRGRARGAGAAGAARAGGGCAIERCAIGVAGLGYWGPNLARNFAGIAGCELAWCCDASTEARERWRAQLPGRALHRRPRRSAGRPDARRRRARHAGADPRALAERVLRRRQALLRREAARAVGRGGRARRRGGRARRAASLMVGHLLEYHPGVAKLKEIAASGELGDIHYIYSNRLNLGQAARGRERAVVARAHDVSVVLHLAEEEPFELERARRVLHAAGRSRTSCSATCASRPAWPRTCTCPGWTRTRSAASRSSAPGGWRRSTTWTSSAR